MVCLLPATAAMLCCDPDSRKQQPCFIVSSTSPIPPPLCPRHLHLSRIHRHAPTRNHALLWHNLEEPFLQRLPPRLIPLHIPTCLLPDPLRPEFRIPHPRPHPRPDPIEYILLLSVINQHCTNHHENDQGVLDEGDQFHESRSFPLDSHAPLVDLLVRELLCAGHGVEIRRPILVSSVGVVPDVKCIRWCGGRVFELEAETPSETVAEGELCDGRRYGCRLRFAPPGPQLDGGRRGGLGVRVRDWCGGGVWIRAGVVGRAGGHGGGRGDGGGVGLVEGGGGVAGGGSWLRGGG